MQNALVFYMLHMADMSVVPVSPNPNGAVTNERCTHSYAVIVFHGKLTLDYKMSILQLHHSAVAPRENAPAILSVPGDRWRWGASGCAGQGHILPYVSHQVDWRLREQWAHCGGKSESYFG